jgi:hypothetical protein
MRMSSDIITADGYSVGFGWFIDHLLWPVNMLLLMIQIQWLLLEELAVRDAPPQRSCRPGTPLWRTKESTLTSVHGQLRLRALQVVVHLHLEEQLLPCLGRLVSSLPGLVRGRLSHVQFCMSSAAAEALPRGHVLTFVFLTGTWYRTNFDRL